MFSFDPCSPAIDADPFPCYRVLRDEHPCFWSPEAQMWILSRYADIVGAGQDWQTSSSASGNLMTALPGRAGARQVFAPLRGVDRFDFKDVSSQFTVKVPMAALGLPMGDEALVDESEVRENAVLMVQSDARTRAKGPEHIAAYNWMQDYASKVIALRRAEPRNDLTSHFSMAEIDGDRLTEREVLLTTTTLIMAGVESLGGGVHACLGTAIARLAVKIAFEEFHAVVPSYRRVADQPPWMPSSTFRSPLRLDIAVN